MVSPDAVAQWPDGSRATLEEVRDHACGHPPDDSKFLGQADHLRLKEPGIVGELDMS